MENQLYLFIIWEQSRNKSDDIISDIQSKFIMREIFEITCSEKYFLNNLVRFYGHALPDPKKKTLLCGTGSFLLIVVEDKDPIFVDVIDFHGRIKKNENMSKQKMKYRELVGKEFSIHGSISEKETNYNLTLLLHKTTTELQKELPKKWNGSIKKLNSDLFGCNGWKNIEEFFKMLNGTVRYVILRNYEDLSINFTLNKHNDIDILTDGDVLLPYVCMTNNSESPKGKMPQIIINENTIPIDWKRPGDSFYDKRWYNDILNRRVLHNNQFYVPSQHDYLHTLFYHMIFHKRTISKEYKEKIIDLANILNITQISEDLLNDFNASKKYIEKYMKEMNYSHPTSFKYKLRNNELIRLVKFSSFILRKQGLLFFIKEFQAKVIRSISNNN